MIFPAQLVEANTLGKEFVEVEVVSH